MKQEVGKDVSSGARKRSFVFNSSLSCVLALGFFAFPQLQDITVKFESFSRACLHAIESIFSDPVAPAAVALPVADEIKPEKLLESKTSEIYPVLDKARAELAKVAVLDANRVWLSCWNKESGAIEVVELTKQFLRTRAASLQVTLAGDDATVTIDDPNGVNTKVSIQSEKNWLPVTLAYPIDRGGLRIAYYTPAHYQLRTPQLTADGKAYINNLVVNAKEQLASAGYAINASSAEMAAKLAIVEHTDHSRFVNEPHTKLFEEIYSLYALNRGDSYKYSISVAGAGGMIQMIPSTYRIVRQRYPAANLADDFAASMANHPEAMKAMLCYISMTHDYLQSSSVITSALDSAMVKINDLLAAGYNSNPAKLPGYINSFKAAWNSVLPRETKIYLSILHTLETPDAPQVELARGYLQSPSARYHTTTVSSKSVARSKSRYHVQTAAHKNKKRARR